MGLPEITKPSRPQSAFYLLFIKGIENVTRALAEGRGFDDQALADLTLLRRRADGFIAAFDARIAVIDTDPETSTKGEGIGGQGCGRQRR